MIGVPSGYRVVETDQRVDTRPVGRYVFRRSAQRCAARLNARRLMPSYRYEVQRTRLGWAVVAKQNVLEPVERA